MAKQVGTQKPQRRAMEVLLNFPLRFEDWESLHAVGELVDGQLAFVEGEITAANTQFINRRQNLFVHLQDKHGDVIVMRFFYAPKGLVSAMTVGRQLRARGTVRRGRRGLELMHPKLQGLHAEQKIVAVYPTIDKIAPPRYAKMVEKAFAAFNPRETIPYEIEQKLREENLAFGVDAGWTLAAALRAAHAPSASDGVSLLEASHPAWQRLRFEELLAHQIVLRYRYHFQTQTALAIKPPKGWAKPLLDELPFELTAAQKRVLKTIGEDLAMTKPMRRLLQGDVGCGKTMVAIFSCLAVLRCEQKVAVMAPTEILAEQLYQVFSQYLQQIGIHCELLTGTVRGKMRKDALSRLEFGISNVVIGTHTLFQENLTLPKIALTIIDEQHRFGVEQRRAFSQKGAGAHQLMMSATPIPRSLALGLYADMDISVIDEKPQAQQSIKTSLLSNERRGEVLQRVQQHIARGGMVYWVCPLIETNEQLDLLDVNTLAEQVATRYPNLQMGVIHGRMKSAEKKAVMDSFRAGAFKLLIATTVVEVGVDVPQADVMVIEHADRMGLAQLHQLRGRVGRGDKEGFCLLMYQTPLSDEAKQRLNMMQQTTDGFKIAKCDLDMRGPGEWLGNRQSGLPSLKVARFNEDESLMTLARESADWMLQHKPRRAVRHVHLWLGHFPRFNEEYNT